MNNNKKAKTIALTSEIFSRIPECLQAEIINITPLTVGGSTRFFYRLFTKEQTYILLMDPDREQFNNYKTIGHFLENIGVPVPGFLYIDRVYPFLIAEDLGCFALTTIINRGPTRARTSSIYKAIILKLLEMQVRGIEELKKTDLKLPEFGISSFQAETDYFYNYFITKFCGLHPDRARLDAEFTALRTGLAKETLYFMHRDFQSQNIYRSQDSFKFIDFQSAHRGLLMYDLASLLKDPYVSLGRRLEETLFDYYIERANHDYKLNLDRKNQFSVYQYAGIQRLLQALAAFVKLSTEKGLPWFGQQIKPGLDKLSETLQDIDKFPYLKNLINEVIRLHPHIS